MIVLILIVLGLCFGSFVNALTWRLHEQSKKHSKEDAKKLSIMKGRSICPHCHHQLAAKDLLPLVSWVLLRGKCRYCKKPISWRYPAVELLTTLLFVASYLYWPDKPFETYDWLNFGLWLVCLVGFVALLSYDIRWMLLPNKIVFPLFIPVLASVFAEAIFSTKDMQPFIDAALGGLIGGGIFYILFQISGGKWIGGGDVKLGFLLGILIGGAEHAFLLLFMASLLGTLFILPLMLAKKITHKSRIPFGPFLIVAAVIVQLWGQDILNWYLDTLQ